MTIQRLLGVGVLALSALLPLPGQSTQTQNTQTEKKVDRATSYYNYAMAHLYSELAAAYGNRGEYLNKAIEHYRVAIKADPAAIFLSEELSDLYIQAGQIRTAVTEAEDALKANPDDLTARRILARIYSRLIGDAQQNKVNEEMLKKSIEQYSRIVEKEPKDVDSWVMLGRLSKVAQNSPESEKAYKKALEIDPENEEANVGIAMVYNDLGDSKTATAYLEKVARKNPNLRTLTTLASTYEQMRDYKLAAETLKKAIEFGQGNPDLKRAYAQNLLFADQLADALGVYRELVEEEPKDTQSWLRISQIYRQQRKFDEAHQASAKAKALEPSNLEIQFNEVSVLEAEGKMPEAIQSLKELLATSAKTTYGQEERRNRAVLLERLALLYRNNDQPVEAVDTFRAMSDLDSNLASRAAAQIVETYRGARDFKRAKEEADAAMAKYPADRMIKVISATLLADMGQAQQGAALLKTLFDGKSDRETYLSLAQIYDKAKDYGEMARAIDAAEKLATSDDEKEGIYFMRGAMFEKQKKFDEAEREFRKVLAIDADNAGAMNYLGYMFADRNTRLPEAQRLIEKALEQDPNNGAYLDSLGWVYFRQDKLVEAENALVKAIQRVPHDPTVFDHLGDVYARQGRFKDAIVQWQNSLREWKAGAPTDLDPAEVARVQRKLDTARVKVAQESPPQAKP